MNNQKPQQNTPYFFRVGSDLCNCTKRDVTEKIECPDFVGFHDGFWWRFELS